MSLIIIAAIVLVFILFVVIGMASGFMDRKVLEYKKNNRPENDQRETA